MSETPNATPDQAAAMLTTIGLRPVHSSALQLRVDAMTIALQAHDKTRWGDTETTSDQYDDQLIATYRKVYAALTEEG